MTNPREVNFQMCGTPERWEEVKDTPPYCDMHNVIPAILYTDGGGIALVTSSEWVDWLLGRRDEVPNG